MPANKLTIPIDSIIADFQDFITPDSNKRIIFSGPFGIGKTYFLNKFFNGKTEEYLPIFLRPVNYSLLSNEDVFKLIKYDILYQLIQFKEFKIDDAFRISKGDFTKFFVAKNGFAILSNLLKLIPKIQTTVETVEKLGELIQAYKNGLDDVTQNPELKLMFDFQLETQENFLLEYDQVSQLISEQLTEIARNKPGEAKPLKKVLVIDDLDRLDPEHIFRLFNVFSAHFDQVHYYSDEGEKPADNKFGFNKIIFVCDIENIRKIFAHKYGTEVDFSGYIDKFYSSRPYHFLNYESINNFIKKDLRLTDTPASANYFIQMVVFFLMGNKMINLRKVENLLADHQKNELNPSDPLISTWDQIKVQKDELEWITHLSPLKSLYGEYEKLMSLIHQAADYNNDIQMTIDDTLKYFKKTIVASALYQTIRLKYQEQSRRINDYNSINVDYNTSLIKIGFRTFTTQNSIQLSEFTVDINEKEDHNILQFKDFRSAFIATLKLGLKTKLLQ